MKNTINNKKLASYISKNSYLGYNGYEDKWYLENDLEVLKDLLDLKTYQQIVVNPLKHSEDNIIYDFSDYLESGKIHKYVQEASFEEVATSKRNSGLTTVHVATMGEFYQSKDACEISKNRIVESYMDCCEGKVVSHQNKN